MGFDIRHWSWPRRVTVGIGVLVPCLLFWGAREAGSWRPQIVVSNVVITDTAFSPVEPLLACTTSNYGDSSVEMWDSQRRTLLWKQRGGEGRGTVAFSPDGKVLASANLGITIWDAHTGKRIRTIKAPRLEEDSDSQFQFSSDGMMLITGGAKVRRYDVITGRLIQTPALASVTELPRFRAMRSKYSYGLFTILSHFWVPPDTGSLIVMLDFSLNKSEYPAGDADALGQEIWICDAKGHLQTRLAGAGYVAGVSPDSRWVVTYPPGDLDFRELQLWDLRTKKKVRRLAYPTLGGAFDIKFGSAGFSADSTRIYAAVADKQNFVTIVIWDVASGRVLRHFPLEPIPQAQMDLALSADNSQLAVTGVDSDVQNNTLRLWRVR